MTVRDSTTLKSYFNLANVITPSNYVDLIDTVFAQGIGGVGGEHDHDDRYVQRSIANTIFAVHTFTPSTYGPPFILGSNAQGQTVIGFKADQLDKSISVSGLGLSGGGALTANQTITLTSSSNPTNAQILASDANGYLSLIKLKTDSIEDKTGSGTNLILMPSGDIILNPIGKDVLPYASYDISLGSINKKYLTLHAAELWVETLVAASTMATIGGRILVGPTTTLTTDLSNGILINNISFETAGVGGADVFSDWAEIANAGTIIMDNTVFHNGSYSCKLTSAATVPEVQQNVLGGVTPNATYTIIFWTRGDGTNSGQYAVYDVTHSSYIIAATSTGIAGAGTTWTRLAIAFTVPAGCTTARIDFLGPVASGGIAWFDDVYVYYSTILVKHNEMYIDDIVYMEAGGALESFRVVTAPSGSGPYSYGVVRDWDGTGANQWYAGDAIFNTGTIGDGFMDLYSIRGIKGRVDGATTDYGPTIVGNVRSSLAFSGWIEHWAIGNLNGLYGYSGNTYGFAAGKYADGSPFISVDSTSGLLIRYRWGGVNYTLGRWDMSGNILIGQEATSQDNIYISAGAISIRNNTTERIGLTAAGFLTIKDSSGAAVFTFNSTAGAEFTLPLTIASTGGIYQGSSGSFASPGTGLKIWNESGVGRIAGYNATIPQWYAGTDGVLYAGSGAVKLDINGVSIEVPTSPNNINSYKFVSGGQTVGSIYAYADDYERMYINIAPFAAKHSTLYISSTSYINYQSTVNIQALVNDQGSIYGPRISIENYGGGSQWIDMLANEININGDTLNIGNDTTFSDNVTHIQGTIVRFPHTNQLDGSDGGITAGFHGEGLNIVGVQTETGHGRKIQLWGDILLNGSIRVSTALGASVYNNANLTLTSSQWTFLTFNAEWWDTDAIHDTGSNTGRLVCKTAGKYLVIANVAVQANATGVRALSINYNASRTMVAVQSDLSPKASDNSFLTVTVLMNLAVNDYVEVSLYQNSGGNLNAVYANAYSPSFQMILIS